MRQDIPYAKQSISDADIAAVVRALKSDYITQGPEISAFESEVAEYCGAKYAVAVSSGTTGLYIGCQSLGLAEGDWLWTSPVTFVASANCALSCGAQVDFVDIDPQTYNLSVSALREKLIIAAKEDRLPKVVVPVHLAGQSCDMEAISGLAQEYGFHLLEDASHGIGGSYQNRPVGNCQYSEMTVFSFHPVKIITTGEGGMVLTNSLEHFNRLSRLRTHGITRDESLMQQKSHGPWYYEQHELSNNYRITDIQAALGRSQFSRIDQFIQKRHEIVENYTGLLKDLPITLPWQHSDTYSSFHLYVIRLELDKLRKTHLAVFQELREEGIGVNLHYIPVYLQPYYKKLGFKAGLCPEAEHYYAEAISLPMFADLTRDEQGRVAEVLQSVLSV
ncbi:MAG: UDP-4-amino-4,6-dideoxy-N-acetyl-beta-L-altrosamine transaminase [Verrucomicrobiota bacterium]